MKFKIGDRVKISKKKALVQNNILPIWYSDEVYTVKEINKKIVTVDKILLVDNKINICYLKSLKKERKKKLLRLNALSIMG